MIVKSDYCGLIEQSQFDKKVGWEEQGILGAKNLLKNNAVTATINGVTFTVNSDGTITANGTATGGDALFNLCFEEAFTDLVNIPLILSGCPSGGGLNKYGFQIYRNTNPIIEYGEGANITVLSSDLSNNIRARILVWNGTTVNNIVFKPMLRLASDTDPTYVPYAMTNSELTSKIKDEGAITITLDTTQSKYGWEGGVAPLGRFYGKVCTIAFSVVPSVVDYNWVKIATMSKKVVPTYAKRTVVSNAPISATTPVSNMSVMLSGDGIYVGGGVVGARYRVTITFISE